MEEYSYHYVDEELFVDNDRHSQPSCVPSSIVMPSVASWKAKSNLLVRIDKSDSATSMRHHHSLMHVFLRPKSQSYTIAYWNFCDLLTIHTQSSQWSSVPVHSFAHSPSIKGSSLKKPSFMRETWESFGLRLWCALIIAIPFTFTLDTRIFGKVWVLKRMISEGIVEQRKKTA
jgi:hypothetical protein